MDAKQGDGEQEDSTVPLAVLMISFNEAHNIEAVLDNLDGFALAVDKDVSRAVSFEHVSATQRDKRDTGDDTLFTNLKLFPLRYNGGGTIDRVNNRSIPSGWPMARYPVPSGKGVRLGFDLLATNVPVKAKKFKLYVLGVLGEKVTVKARGWANRK